MIRRFISPFYFHIFKSTQGSAVMRENNICVYNSPTTAQRFLSDNSKVEKYDVDFEEVKNAISNDVREPEEIKELGKIPNSINIPLDKLYTALNTMNEELFKKTYNRNRPSEDSEIIFYCMIGKRSGMAQKNAYDLGYKNVKNYVGSYTDWAKKYKLESGS